MVSVNGVSIWSQPVLERSMDSCCSVTSHMYITLHVEQRPIHRMKTQLLHNIVLIDTNVGPHDTNESLAVCMTGGARLTEEEEEELMWPLVSTEWGQHLVDEDRQLLGFHGFSR